MIGSREQSSVIGILGAKPPLSLLESVETSLGDELFDGFSDWSVPLAEIWIRKVLVLQVTRLSFLPP